MASRNGPEGLCTCGALLEGRSDARHCSSACRQRAYRDRRRAETRWAQLDQAMATASDLIGVDYQAVIRNAASGTSRNGDDDGQH